MSIDQATLEAAITEALEPHGLLRRERTPGEDGTIIREGWSAFLFPTADVITIDKLAERSISD
jgi:hypothetical protein